MKDDEDDEEDDELPPLPPPARANSWLFNATRFARRLLVLVDERALLGAWLTSGGLVSPAYLLFVGGLPSAPR